MNDQRPPTVSSAAFPWLHSSHASLELDWITVSTACSLIPPDGPFH